MSKNRGFTLFEVLVYLALMSILISGVFVSGYQMLESGVWIKQKANTYINEQFAFQKIENVVREGNVLEPVVLTEEGYSTSTELVVDVGETEVRVYVEDGRLWIKRGDGEVRALTPRASHSTTFFCERALNTNTPKNSLTITLNFDNTKLLNTIWLP